MITARQLLADADEWRMVRRYVWMNSLQRVLAAHERLETALQDLRRKEEAGDRS
jgi:hypothetical protein